MRMRSGSYRRAFRVSFAALALSLSAVAANAVDLPTRKAGLWEISMEMGSGRAMAMSQCTDATTDKEMSTMAGPMTQDQCTRNELQKTATGYSIDSVCKFGGKTSTTRSDISGDFNSAYTVKISSSSDGAASTAMTMNAKWVGACKPDQKAGDIMMPGGMKMNIKDMQAMKGAIPKR